MSSTGMPMPMANRVGYALKRAQQALRTCMDDVLRPHGLTTPQYSVLSALELDPGISNAALARAVFVTAQTMQGLVGNLEREGLLRRSIDAKNRRILNGELTASGRTILRRAHRLVAEVEAKMTGSLSEREALKLAVMLTSCAENLIRSPKN
jgi:DNA-binding MarR family transcriptional regulator